MDTTKTIRLASYNIHKGVGLDGRRKPSRILDVLNTLDADAVALQEVDRRLGARPCVLCKDAIATETDFYSVELSRDGPSLGWHGNAVLLRKGMNATRVERLDLPGTEPRGAVSVVVNGNVQIVATHLGLMRSDRRAQLHQIREHLMRSACPSVIIGDFNEWRKTRGLEPLLGEYQVTSPGRSFHAARPVAALDRVATCARIELRDAGVRDTKQTRIASDHLPIWADIRMAG